MKSNADSFAKKISGMVRGVLMGAKTGESEIRHIVGAGIRSHFDKLGAGGVDMDAFGATKGSRIVVKWSQDRGRLTMGARGFAGKGIVFPMLQLHGGMKRAYTEGLTGVSRGERFGLGSKFAAFSTDFEARKKASRNQAGGRFWTTYHTRKGEERARTLFWSRPFLYWDALMADRVKLILIREGRRRRDGA